MTEPTQLHETELVMNTHLLANPNCSILGAYFHSLAEVNSIIGKKNVLNCYAILEFEIKINKNFLFSS